MTQRGWRASTVCSIGELSSCNGSLLGELWATGYLVRPDGVHLIRSGLASPSVCPHKPRLTHQGIPPPLPSLTALSSCHGFLPGKVKQIHKGGQIEMSTFKATEGSARGSTPPQVRGRSASMLCFAWLNSKQLIGDLPLPLRIRPLVLVSLQATLCALTTDPSCWQLPVPFDRADLTCWSDAISTADSRRSWASIQANAIQWTTLLAVSLARVCILGKSSCLLKSYRGARLAC